MEDTELIAQIRDGNVDAFDKLVERYQRQLYYYAIGKVAEHTEAQDIVQKSFVTADHHLDQFIETANKQQAIGRTLEFISQEIGRELNTLGSKANDAEISQIAVHCKAELEKIREQVQNVE